MGTFEDRLLAELRAIREGVERLCDRLPPAGNGALVQVKDKTLLAEWCDRWSARYQGEKYVPNGGKDGAQLKRLDKALGRQELLTRMDRFLADDSEFVVEARHGLGVFISQVNRYGKDVIVSRRMTKGPGSGSALLEQGGYYGDE